jgi:hypothetical protein
MFYPCLRSCNCYSVIKKEAKNREAVQQANPGPKSQSSLRTAPIPFPASGQGRGSRATPHDCTQSCLGLKWSLAITQREQEIPWAQGTNDADTPMPDAQIMQVQHEPDFLFTRLTYSELVLPTPLQKNFFWCTWQVDIPKKNFSRRRGSWRYFGNLECPQRHWSKTTYLPVASISTRPVQGLIRHFKIP